MPAALLVLEREGHIVGILPVGAGLGPSDDVVALSLIDVIGHNLDT